ncbi:serine/threonine-protein kinase [Flectobacillus major]|uniref:serine/threonine-protein kinase n=1 Tax=Flectobacillus major TaxID=103 RepID=UPI000427DDDD|nr:serine/threonine-protein kinase [Flectobacillus major]
MSYIKLKGDNNTYIFNPKDVNSFLGAGGMGRVFSGKKVNTNNENEEVNVAIKVLFRDLTENVNNVERVKRASEIKIKHDNLIEMLDFVEQDGIYHDVSVFVPGENLSDKIASNKIQNKVFSYDEAKPIINGVLNGLEVLHQNGIIHRDIDPSNIRICSDGSVKLMDYGVVRITGGKTKSLTGVGTLIGKPNYSPPEQIKGENDKIKETTDLYALGITIYEMLTGNPPFEKGNEFDTMQAQVSSPLPKNSILSDAIYDFLDKATAKEPINRFQSVAEFRNALNNPQAIDWWRKKQVQIMGLCGIVVTLGVIGFYLNHNHKITHHQENYQKASDFLEIAHYDSATVYFDKALEYIDADSTKQKSAMLHELVPAMSAFYNAKYKEAFSKLQKASDLGSGDADYYLGELTYNGLGTVKDYNKGWEYTNKAIKKGFKMAYWRIANAYQTGKGVLKDPEKADRYYLEAIEAMKKLAESGDPEALGNLGAMYSSGDGVSKNNKIAFEYYLKSANKEYAFIQSNLAQMYFYGNGTDINFEEAAKWYKKSAEKGHPTAQLALGNMYLEGIGMPQDIIKGLELINSAAKQNYSSALSRLGYLYYMGKYVATDYERSFQYTKKAVDYDNDNITAIENLAFDYKEGTGVEKDYAEAKKYYLKAIKQDSSTAGKNYLRIALLYLKGGYKLKSSESEFIIFCELSEQHGNVDATKLLGIYYNENGVKYYNSSSYIMARDYFEKAIAKGNVQAKNNLRIMNLNER